MNIIEKRGKANFSLMKTGFMAVLFVISVIVFVVYGILYFAMKLYKNDDDHFYIINLIILGSLTLYNDPFNMLHFFFNANWISDLDSIIYTLFQTVSLGFIFLHLDHCRTVCLIKL